MSFIVKASEGKKRLRLFVSVLVSIATYICFLINEYDVRPEEAFLAFPLFSVLGFGVAFCFITAAYWVIDGFENENARKFSASNVTGLELFEIADGASVEFQSKLIKIAGLEKTGDEQLDNINQMIFESWLQPSLAYTFALTCICMLKSQKMFLQSNSAKEFVEMVSSRLRDLSDLDSAKLMNEKRDPVKAKEYSDSQVKRMILGALFFLDNIMKRTKGTDPLEALNDYVAEITGLKESVHYEKMSEAGKILLGKINKQLVSSGSA